MTMDQFLERLEQNGHVRPIPTGYLANCPAHDDRTASLSVSEAPDRILLFCHANCDTRDVLDAMGLEWKHLYFDETGPSEPYVKPEPEAEFIYTDEANRELYRVLRYPNKQFRHRFRRVPYRLVEVIFARDLGRSIYICEGEKDVEALRAAGKTATCNSGGAGKWLPEFDKYFEDAKVIIVADRDAPGLAHAQDVAACLLPVAKSIHVVQARVGKDASDHLEAGLRPEDFIPIMEVK